MPLEKKCTAKCQICQMKDNDSCGQCFELIEFVFKIVFSKFFN